MISRFVGILGKLRLRRRAIIMAVVATLGITVAAAAPAQAWQQVTTPWGIGKAYQSGELIVFQYSDHGQADGHCVIGQFKFSANGPWQNSPQDKDCTTTGWTNVKFYYGTVHGLRIKRTGLPAAYATVCGTVERCRNVGGP
jgi:hypothetical protein